VTVAMEVRNNKRNQKYLVTSRYGKDILEPDRITALIS
jgi:hypothetical protein